MLYNLLQYIKKYLYTLKYYIKGLALENDCPVEIHMPMCANGWMMRLKK